MMNASDSKAQRAGVYVLQPAGDRAFIPKPLQPDPPARANHIESQLEGIGLLKEMTGYARNRRFRFDPYLRLFEDPEEARP